MGILEQCSFSFIIYFEFQFHSQFTRVAILPWSPLLCISNSERSQLSHFKGSRIACISLACHQWAKNGVLIEACCSFNNNSIPAPFLYDATSFSRSKAVQPSCCEPQWFNPNPGQTSLESSATWVTHLERVEVLRKHRRLEWALLELRFTSHSDDPS